MQQHRYATASDGIDISEENPGVLIRVNLGANPQETTAFEVQGAVRNVITSLQLLSEVDAGDRPVNLRSRNGRYYLAESASKRKPLRVQLEGFSNPWYEVIIDVALSTPGVIVAGALSAKPVVAALEGIVGVIERVRDMPRNALRRAVEMARDQRELDELLAQGDIQREQVDADEGERVVLAQPDVAEAENDDRDKREQARLIAETVMSLVLPRVAEDASIVGNSTNRGQDIVPSFPAQIPTGRHRAVSNRLPEDSAERALVSDLVMRAVYDLAYEVLGGVPAGGEGPVISLATLTTESDADRLRVAIELQRLLPAFVAGQGAERQELAKLGERIADVVNRRDGAG